MTTPEALNALADREPLPNGVYYRAESDNFYLASANVGMGWNFWQKWRHRKFEFPTSASLRARAADMQARFAPHPSPSGN